jgi:ATP-dependent DNA ligase
MLLAFSAPPVLHWSQNMPGPNWLHEIKHDGFRILARREADGVRLIARQRPRCFPVMPITDRAEQVTY